MGAKLILICGAGKGKTIIGNSLALLYRANGIAFIQKSVSSVAEARKIAKEAEQFCGFVMVLSNLSSATFADIDFWQVIDVHGGSVLKQADFFEMATEGFGLPGKTLYGMLR